MNETTITLTGYLTADPELRFTASGTAVANFTVATNPRRYDRDAGDYVDSEPLFMRCTAWKQLAENTAESFRRGDRVIVTGILRQRSWETDAGDKRTSTECTVTDLGASALFAQVKIAKLTRTHAATTSAGEEPGTDEPPF